MTDSERKRISMKTVGVEIREDIYAIKTLFR